MGLHSPLILQIIRRFATVDVGRLTPAENVGLSVVEAANLGSDSAVDVVLLSLMTSGQTLIAGEAPPPSANPQEIQLKFLLTGLLSGLPLPPFAIRMCPPLTTKNIGHYQPLLAVGG